MEEVQKMVFELRRRVAELEANVQGCNSELNSLKQLPCPECNGAGNFQVHKEGDGNMVGMTYSEKCKICDGTGKAAGNTRGY